MSKKKIKDASLSDARFLPPTIVSKHGHWVAGSELRLSGQARTPDATHQKLLTVICNGRARFFGFRTRPREQSQSVSSIQPLSPNSMIKKKKLRERNSKIPIHDAKNSCSYFFFRSFLSLSGGTGVPAGAVEFFVKKKACTSLQITEGKTL